MTTRPRIASRLRALLVVALFVAGWPAAAVEPTEPIVDIHAIRAELWTQGQPRTPEDLRKLKETAVEWEKVTRKRVLDDLAAHLREMQLRPPVPSGTPPHLTGGSGALTDVDMTFATLEEAQEAARYLQGKGYSVQWNTADTFSVRELDYTGFANTRPAMRPGSPEEVRFLREASRFPDKLWTKGSQQWVEGATLESAIGNLKEYQATLRSRLGQEGLTARQIQATEIKLARAESRLASLKQRLQAVHVTDRTGFTADMMKKAIHHVETSDWGPMFERFSHHEDPRQAAKAGARALRELAQRTPEQSAQMQYLDDIAKGRAVLPSTPAELAAAKERLAAMVNRSMHEAWEAATTADAALDQALVAEYKAAAASGEAAAISRARAQLAGRQLAARRLEAVLDGLVEIENAEASQALHEWLTGERLRLVERPGQAPHYEVVEETAEGLRVVGRRTPAQVKESGLEALEAAALRKAGKWAHPLGGYEPPSFASVSTEGMTVAGKAKAVARSPLLLLMAGYAAWQGADQATQAMDENWEVLELSDLGDWESITAEKIGGWARATFLGTVLGIGELTGISHVVRSATAQEDLGSGVAAGAYAACEVLVVCTLYELSQWYWDEAIRIETEAAAREGRPVSRIHIFENLIQSVPFREFGEKVGHSLADWGAERSVEIREAMAAELEAVRSWYAGSEIGAELEAVLGSGGLDKLASMLGELRLQTAAIEDAWRDGTHDLDQAIFWNQEIQRLMELLEPPPDFEEECREALEEYTDTRPTEADLARLRAGWEEELEERAKLIELVRNAALETVSHGLNSAYALDEPAVWALAIHDQQELQRELAGRFGRLTLALPGDTQLAAWRAEIQSAATPVPVDQRQGLVLEARDLVTAADAVLRRLEELAAQQVPECTLAPLPPPVNVETGVAGNEDEPEEAGVTGGGADEGAAVAAPSGDGLSEAQVLVLAATEIPFPSGDFELRHQPGSTGFALVHRSDSHLDYFCPEDATWNGCSGTEQWWRDLHTWREITASLRIDAPPRIVMGQPFSVTADLRVRDAQSASYGDCHAEGDLPEDRVYSVRVHSADLIAQAETPESATHVHCDRRVVCDHHGLSAGAGGPVYGAPCLTGASEKDASLTFDAFFVPVEVERLESGARRYSYSLDHPADVAALGEERSALFTESGNDDGSDADWAEIVVAFSIGSDRSVLAPAQSILLRYRPEAVAGAASAVPYEHPPELLRPPVEEPWRGAAGETAGADRAEAAGATEGTGQPGATGVAVPGAESSGDSPPPGGVGEIDPGRRETATTVTVPPVPRIDTSDPSRLDPDRQPEVASLVREWLAAAEPPENAVPGVDFRYDELGRKIGGGGTTGRVISSHAAADYGSGASSEARVWSALRRELDSVDHCTLEEYVLARLEERSIEPCRGRYGAVRELGGVPLAAARAEVQGAGFQVALAPGSPAPSPEAEGTIERQQPPASQSLRRGETLTLVVHAPHVPAAIAAPDVVGLSRPEAKRRLEALGLVAALRPGAPARSPAESDTVEAQEPAAGAPLERGAAVAIRVRSPFVAIATIPDLVGLSTHEAKARLAVAGIDSASVDLIPGSPAPSPALAGAVEAQEPPTGATVATGGRITLRVHSGFVDLRTVPAVVGLSLGEARQRLESLGLAVELAPGRPAASPLAEGSVEEQSPAAGASVGAGAVVTLAIHGPYLPPATPVPLAVPTPLTGRSPAGEQPPLSCPQTLYKHAVPGTNLCPDTWWTLVPGSGQVRSASWGGDFECSYQLLNARQLCAQADRYIDVRWIAAGTTQVGAGAHKDFCTEDSYYDSEAANTERMRRGEEPMMTRSHWKLHSRSRKVRVELYSIGWDEQLGLDLAREMISRVEPFAAPCAGAAIPVATPAPPPPTPTPWPQPAGSCFIQEYPGQGEVNLLFAQPGDGGFVILHLLSVPAGADGPISQQMASIGARLVGSYGSYQAARSAGDSICAGVTGGGAPPTPTPPPGPPACPGPAVTVVYDLWNPPPYGGLGGIVCQDAAGALWLNISNNIYPVTGFQAGAQDPASGCWPDTGVVTPAHTYGGILCRK